MDVQRQIEYWITTAEDDLETSTILIDRGKILQGLFFCHLCVEKAIKAHFVRCAKDFPPKSHNLSFLLDKTNLILDEAQLKVCDTLMYYQLEGRYPEHYPKAPSLESAVEVSKQAQSLFLWLKKKL
ncbi:MAG: HEPN domain-containing protein [Bacteroidetes bacterium]|nr:HEPN domain-containing protein [Bacteroidota bacterium]MBU1720279.1 HEPN domain-containing protein [Bacteroidota bacterium]